MAATYLAISSIALPLAIARLVSLSSENQTPGTLLLFFPALVLTMLVDVLLAGLCTMLNIPAPRAMVVGTIHLVLAILLASLLRGSRRSILVKLTDGDVRDFLGLLAIVVVAAACGFMQFGFSLNLNFSSTDPATHFANTLTVLDSGRVEGMYFTYYISSLVIEVLQPFTGFYGTYKAFIVAEIGYYTLNTCVFYSLLRVAGSKHVPSFCVSVLYMLGYPLNNMVFGFSYLGAGVTLFLTFTFMWVAFWRPGSYIKLFIASLIVILGGIVCYSLFVPVIALSLLLLSVAHFRDAISRHILAFGILAASLIIATTLLIRHAILAGLVSGLSTPGYTYVELYGSFILIAPAAIFGLVKLIQDRQSSFALPSTLISIAVIVVTAIALLLYKAGVFSAYYYYKFYYLLWPIAFLCTARGLTVLLSESRAFLVCYLACIASILVLSLSRIDRTISTRHPDLSPSAASESITGVYNFNLNEMESPKISDEEVNLWIAVDQLRTSSDQYIPLLGTNIDVYWYQAQTKQHYAPDARYFYFWLYNTDDWGSVLVDRLSEVDYCAILHTQDLPDSVKQFLSSKEIIYQNSAGYIVKLE